MNVPVSRPADAPFRGVLMMCVAVACFAAMNTFVKELRVQELPVVEIIWGRYFFHTILVLALFPKRIPTLLSGSDKGLQICRSILVLAATACMFTAVGFMPLADAVAITFIAPLLITALSVPFLGERVGLRRWIAVCVGFAGMLVIIRPGGGLFQPAALLPIGVTAVDGQFVYGDVVALIDPQGQEFARGLVNYDRRDAGEIVGLHSEQISERLGSLPYTEIVHRDNMVIFNATDRD